MNKAILISFIVFWVNTGFSQDNDFYENFIKEVINKQENIMRNMNNKDYLYYNFSINTVSYEKDGGNENTLDIKSYFNKSHFILISPIFEMYKDTLKTIVLYTKLNEIYIYKNSDKLQKALVNNYLAFKDSIISSFKFIAGKKGISKKNTPITIIHFKPKSNSNNEVENVVYYFNSTTYDIKKIEINYLPNYFYRKATYTFNEINYNYDKNLISALPKNSKLFEISSIRSKYPNYKVIDKRNKH